MMRKCLDCSRTLSLNNKSGFCRECFLKRKRPKLEEAEEVKKLLADIASYTVDKRRKR